MAAEGEDQSSLLVENGGEGSSQREDVSIEKRNLINLIKLSVKSLIEAAMKRPQALTDSHTQLRQLLIALEHCLKHRLKGIVCCCLLFIVCCCLLLFVVCCCLLFVVF